MKAIIEITALTVWAIAMILFDFVRVPAIIAYRSVKGLNKWSMIVGLITIIIGTIITGSLASSIVNAILITLVVSYIASK